MAAPRELLTSEIRKDSVQVSVHCARKIMAQSAATVAAFRKPEPVLPHLTERVPSVEQAIGNRP